MELEEIELGDEPLTEDEPRISVLAEFALRDVRYEIHDGVPLELPPVSVNAGKVANDLTFALTGYGHSLNRGTAFTEMLIKLPASPNRNRRPDTIFVPFSRWPKGKALPNSNAWEILPELCVEVLSPNDMMEDILARMKEFFDAGVTQTWIVSPVLHLVQVYRSMTQAEIFSREQTLRVEDRFAGFGLPLAELFPLPDPPSPTA